MTVTGYARISAFETSKKALPIKQQLHAQGCEVVHIESQSSRTANKRSVLESILSDLQKDDTLVIPSLFRFARSIKDLLQLIQRIEETGAVLVVLDQNINTVNGFTLQEITQHLYEMDYLLKEEYRYEKIRASGAAGRPARIDKDHVIELRNEGLTYREIGQALGISRGYARNVCREYGHFIDK